MWLFGKKETILEGKDKAALERAEQQLNDAGIRTHSWGTEPMPVGGCGAKMRPSDYAGTGTKAEPAMLYHLEVRKEDAGRAKQILGIALVITHQNKIPLK